MCCLDVNPAGGRAPTLPISQVPRARRDPDYRCGEEMNWATGRPVVIRKPMMSAGTVCWPAGAAISSAPTARRNDSHHRRLQLPVPLSRRAVTGQRGEQFDDPQQHD